MSDTRSSDPAEIGAPDATRRGVTAVRRIVALAAAALSAWMLPEAAQATPDHVVVPGPAGVSLEAELFRPAGPGPFPAVVALHGCGGLYVRGGRETDRRSLDWGERLAAAGFLVLFPDSFGRAGCRRNAGSASAPSGRAVSGLPTRPPPRPISRPGPT